MGKIPQSILFIAIACIISSCSGRKQWQKEEGAVWATTYHITYLSEKELSDSIQDVMRQVELSLSPFNPQSTISRINDNHTDSTDALIDSVMAISLRVNRISGGMYDPTVSPLINLWGFGYTGHPSDDRLPSPTQAMIDSALNLVGIAECSIADGRMIKKSPGTTFNFSSVTKGLGCDMVGAMLKRNGVTDYMVEIGGEMALSGRNPRGKKWRIQIADPASDRDGQQAMRVIELTDCGIATSGNYRNYLTDKTGTRHGHTISPLTGQPIQTDIVSATVIAPTCAEADALGTACMASTLPQAEAMLRSLPSVSAILATSPSSSTDSLQIISINMP